MNWLNYYYIDRDLIFIPIVLMVSATIFIYGKLYKTRFSLFKDGIGTVKDYKLNESEPKQSRQINNALRNQFESPVLFYVLCLSAYVSSTVSILLLAIAFIYCILKTFHIRMHTGDNIVMTRMKIFVHSMQVLMAGWTVFVLQLLITRIFT